MVDAMAFLANKEFLLALSVVALVGVTVAWALKTLTYSDAPSLDDPAIKSKFEPWLWEKVKALETNETTRFYTLIVGVNCAAYKHNSTAAYEFRKQVATLLAEEHNATILSIGKLLSYINVEVRVPDIKRIAAYDFVDGLGDGEAEIEPD